MHKAYLDVEKEKEASYSQSCFLSKQQQHYLLLVDMMTTQGTAVVVGVE